MPVIFIHGVNVRKNRNYFKYEAQRKAFIHQYLLPSLFDNPDEVFIESPYWGVFASNPKWNNASLPSKEDNIESLGDEDDDLELEVDAKVIELLTEIDVEIPQHADTMLVKIATESSLLEAVDLLLAIPVADAEVIGLAEMSQIILSYAEATPHPQWLSNVTHDDAFITQLETEVTAWQATQSTVARSAEYDIEEDDVESLGVFTTVWDSLSENVSRIGSVVGNKTSDAVLAMTRKPAHNAISGFLGDILVYTNERGDKGNPGEIVKLVESVLDEAVAKKTEKDDKLIILAHSMGGNIAYDILSYFRPDIVCDVLITVGSQPGFFEELKQFKASEENVPNSNQTHVAKLPNIKHWINVFDRNDILSFTTGSIFEGAEDFSYNTGSSLLTAHTTYFRRPSFYKRLSKKLKDMSL